MTGVVVIQGRELSAEDIGLIEGLLAEHRDWGRTRLSEELCCWWDWRNARGRIEEWDARTQLVKHPERRLVTLDSELPLELKGRHPRRLRCHHVGTPEPHLRWSLRPVHDRPGRERGVTTACRASTHPRLLLGTAGFAAPVAVMADKTVRPSDGYQDRQYRFPRQKRVA